VKRTLHRNTAPSHISSKKAHELFTDYSSNSLKRELYRESLFGRRHIKRRGRKKASSSQSLEEKKIENKRRNMKEDILGMLNLLLRSKTRSRKGIKTETSFGG